MNKDEILERSRAESRGHMDEMERAALGRAGSIAAGVGGLVCLLIIVLCQISQLIRNDYVVDFKVNLSAWSVYGLMQGSLFMVKYVKLRKKHELVIAMIYLLIGTASLGFLAYLLFTGA